MHLALHEVILLAATIDFVESRALECVETSTKSVEAAFDLIYDCKIVFENGSARFMTSEEIEHERIENEIL